MRSRLDNAKEWEDFYFIMANLRWYRINNLNIMENKNEKRNESCSKESSKN